MINLKNQLLISGAAALVLLLLGVWLVVRGYVTVAIIILIVMCIYVILINLWFRSYVTDPLAKLAGVAKKIADGQYGMQEEKIIDNEIGELTDAINEMSKKIAMADKSRTEFISQISHELRTPLTAITGWSETIAYDSAVQGDSLRGINIITKEAELPHVKEKFYKGSSKNRGTGIGLSVCDEIVSRHGGSLDIANAEGGGCIVTVSLPKTND